MYENLFKIILLCIVSCAIVVMIVKRFVYFNPISKHVSVQENYTQVKIQHLHGWILDNPDSNTIIIFCHGNSGNISHYEKYYQNFKDLGYIVATFDYSGFGLSSGIPSEQQMYDDASLFTLFVMRKFPSHKIVAYGQSLGGPVATYIARRHNIHYLILESSIQSINAHIKYNYKYLKIFAFLFNEFDTLYYLNGYHGKKMIIHSIDDEIVPYDGIKNMIDYFDLHIVTTGLHTNVAIPWSKVSEFIDN